MIVYDLRCARDHKFEGWFKTAEDFQAQNTGGLLCCPACGTSEVVKLPTASRINRHPSSQGTSGDQRHAAEQALLAKIHGHVDTNYIDVGNQFPEQARRIHYGEVEPAAIRGTATMAEAKELYDEGVNVITLPPAPVDKEKLN